MDGLHLSSKLPQTGLSIFTRMSALAQQHGAINLSQGFPDFKPDAALSRLVSKHMRAGKHQYAPMSGIAPLREQVAHLVKEKYGAEYDPTEEVTITSGATEAIFCAITAVVGEGDEVLVVEPAYDCYVPAITLSGGQPVYTSMNYPDYRINWEEVKKLINQRTKAIILNTPHNPSGAILNKQDVEELERILSGTSIYIISDEVWEHIVFEGNTHHSMARYPELAKRSFIISSFGKALHVTGWKVGYCVAPAEMMAEFRKVHQYVTFCTASPLQYAIADYLEEHLDKVLGLPEFYQHKRDLFLSLIEGSGFKPVPALGTYFQLLSYEGISDESDMDFARRLTIEHGVASIPVSAFYRGDTGEKVLRFCFAKEEKTLKEAAKKLAAI